MNKYPSAITPEILAQNAHIPDRQIVQDIADTEREIELEKVAMAGYEAEAQLRGMPHARMAMFRADGARQGIIECQDFVRFLKLLLEARK